MKIAVLGGSGFIGNHLVARLLELGHEVTSVDIKDPDFELCHPMTSLRGDLREYSFVKEVLSTHFDEVYQLAADMGGAGYIFTGENDAAIMHNSAQINLNVAEVLKHRSTRLFYASSACIYPQENQVDPLHPNCEESSAFPANPDSEYGWEKLFSERLYQSYHRNYGLDIRIARFHNVYGSHGIFDGGREKAPAALCRKVSLAKDGGFIEIWGDGTQTRSFLNVSECVQGMLLLMKSNWVHPLNIGSDEMISIGSLAEMIIGFSEKRIEIKYVPGPVGVAGRCSDNRLILSTLNWKPSISLHSGMKNLYDWVDSQIHSNDLK